MGRLLLSIYSFDIYCPRIDRKSICTPLSARIRQMTRGIPLSPRPENRKNMTAASAAKRRSPPAVPAIAEGAVEKERIPYSFGKSGMLAEPIRMRTEHCSFRNRHSDQYKKKKNEG